MIDDIYKNIHDIQYRVICVKEGNVLRCILILAPLSFQKDLTKHCAWLWDILMSPPCCINALVSMRKPDEVLKPL